MLASSLRSQLLEDRSVDEVAAHLQQAEQNEVLAEGLAGITEAAAVATGWAVVLLHYAAMHYIDAYLISSYGVHSYSHEELAANIFGCRELAALGGLYQELRIASESVRYRMRRVSKEEFHRLKETHYQPLKQVVGALLAATLCAGG